MFGLVPKCGDALNFVRWMERLGLDTGSILVLYDQVFEWWWLKAIIV